MLQPYTLELLHNFMSLCSGNETIEEIAERLKVPRRDLDPKLAKAIVIHGADLNEFDQDQLDNVLRYI